MRGLTIGRLCGQVFQKHRFMCFFHGIPQCPLNASPTTAFLSSPQHLSYRLNGTNSHEHMKTKLLPDNFKADSSEGSHYLLKTNTSPVESARPSEMDILKLGKAADAFLDLGLSPDQAVLLFRVQPEVSLQTRLAVVSELLLLGLSTDSVLKVLQKNSELLKMSVNHLKNRGDLLRRLGFEEERLNHMAIHFPSIFTLPQKRIEATECLLREKCLFTVQQASKILQMCPTTLLEDLNDLEYKFQFVYFRMGVKHKDIVKSGYFQASLPEVKNRFTFLERLGLYQTPDKKGQTQVVNAKLKAIIRASENDFVTRIACSSVEEYRIFKKLLAREKEENWKDEMVMKSELSDLESDEERSDTD